MEYCFEIYFVQQTREISLNANLRIHVENSKWRIQYGRGNFIAMNLSKNSCASVFGVSKSKPDVRYVEYKMREPHQILNEILEGQIRGHVHGHNERLRLIH